MRILHPSGGRLSMRFNDLRLHNTDTVQVGTTLTNPTSSWWWEGGVIFTSQHFYIPPIS